MATPARPHCTIQRQDDSSILWRDVIMHLQQESDQHEQCSHVDGRSAAHSPFLGGIPQPEAGEVLLRLEAQRGYSGGGVALVAAES